MRKENKNNFDRPWQGNGSKSYLFGGIGREAFSFRVNGHEIYTVSVDLLK